ncbi:unnamed protein product [Citrullus colocynthis]|uniref:Receptor-like serine/threonine-protein kinase n=1 Tax=Citrullus colocynthis TaxID=252529 RepID=A0ABP0Z6F6_9ROSI
MKPQKGTNFFHLHLHLLLFCFCLRFCIARNIITSTNFITDPSTLLSESSLFELGFFSPVNTTSRYVGIWLNQGSKLTVVWVANRDNPLNHTSGVFTISKDGNLVVLDGKSNILWTSNILNPTINSTALLLDSGNLILQDSVSGMILWESFKHPSDTFFPAMKIFTNTRTKEKIGLTSWESPSNPSKGRFFFGIDVLNNIAEVYIWEGSDLRWRSGPWNGQSFIGIPQMDSVYYLLGFSLVIENQTYYLSGPNRNELLNYEFYQLTSQGNFEQSHWDDTLKDWKPRWSALKTPCDFYGTCGAFGICDPKSFPVCSCLKGFQPKNEEEWNQGNWGSGCLRKTSLKCEKVKNVSVEHGKEDGFLKVGTVNLPHFAESLNSSVSAEDCGVKCSDDCSCSAYAYESGIGCMLWSGDLIDARKLDFGGATFYLRLTYSELENATKRSKVIVIASVIAGSGSLIIIFIIFVSWRRIIGQKAKEEIRKGKKTILLKERRKFLNLVMDHRMGINMNQELPTYDFEKLAIATNNFHLDNKLGKGGFGPVYKGRLVDGQEIAIKRLSRASNQGVEEFINEVTVISKLQHRNLVRLFGYCVEGEEKMLIYDGYMSPEYAMGGRFSEKSDVFSFGVLLLEIISGKKNSSFYHDEDVLSLLELAWNLWNEENLISFIDPTIYDSRHHKEILRCIHVGLLCVQEAMKDRPNMVTVLSMLNSEIIDLYPPKQPGFSGMQLDSNTHLSQQSEDKYSVNMVTITKLGGR